MSSKTCDTSAVLAALQQLASKNSNAASEAGAISAVAKEARSLASNINAIRWSGKSLDGAERTQGLRNRLVLKYVGIDYEYYNTDDMRYRSTTS